MKVSTRSVEMTTRSDEGSTRSSKL
jgi:hypothetical protein